MTAIPPDKPPIRFGTDGIRGPANEWPLTPQGAKRIGRAIAAWADAEHGENPRVVIGTDTRESGTWLSEAVSEGLVQGGAHALLGGVLPTAAVSCAVLAHNAAAGVMITASHNPWTDNGIKVMVSSGKKLEHPATLEAHIENPGQPRSGGTVVSIPDAISAWKNKLPRIDLSGHTLLLDCAHGAAAPHAPQILEALGARIILRGCQPDGQNINRGVGAMHPPSAAELAQAGAALGLCLDGDADRIILVDPKRGTLDGDDLLWLLAQRVEGPVVGTIMSNGGLQAALGDRLIRAPVGDRFVAEHMRNSGADIGAEPSGHVLFSDGMPTGDGLYAALAVLNNGQGSAQIPLPEFAWTRWEQAKVNIRYQGQRPTLQGLDQPGLAEAAGNRIVVRYSGTEPVVRVMVEGTGTGTDGPSAWAERISKELAG